MSAEAGWVGVVFDYVVFYEGGGGPAVDGEEACAAGDGELAAEVDGTFPPDTVSQCVIGGGDKGLRGRSRVPANTNDEIVLRVPGDFKPRAGGIVVHRSAGGIVLVIVDCRSTGQGGVVHCVDDEV